MAMHPLRKQRLLVVIFIVVVASMAAGLIGFALRENINLFYPPVAVVAGEVPEGRRFRAGGMVVPGSVKREPDSLWVTFDVTDYQATVRVTYEGILPPLFAEDDGVVVTGTLNEQGVILATQVLAKHDENYMPPEVAAALKASAEKKANY